MIEWGLRIIDEYRTPCTRVTRTSEPRVCTCIRALNGRQLCTRIRTYAGINSLTDAERAHAVFLLSRSRE